MTQLIITLLIVFAAAGTAVYLLVKRFRKKETPKDACSGCSSDCGGCALFKEMEKKKEE